MRGTLSFLLAGVLFALCAAPRTAAQDDKSTMVLDIEYGIRQRATSKVEPEFPDEAVKAGAEGVVIAAVQFDESGALSKVEILDAPHPLLKQAVADAVRQWKIKPTTMITGELARRQGELRFYYSVRNGVGQVSAPPVKEQKKLSKKYKAMEKSFRLTTQQ
jgi:TonB family protein